MSLPWIDYRVVLDEALAACVPVAGGPHASAHYAPTVWPAEVHDRAHAVANGLETLEVFADSRPAWRHVTVYVGPPFITYVCVPWQDALIAPRQRLAFAEACWLNTAVAGGQPGDYLWRLAPERYGAPSVAIGICAVTARAVQAWCRTRRIHRLHWRSTLDSLAAAPAGRHGDLWYVSSHAGHMMLAEVNGRAWRNAFTLARNGLSDAALLNAAHRLLGTTPQAIGLMDADRLARPQRLASLATWHDAATLLDQT